MKRWIGASLALALGMTLTVPALASEEYPNDMALTNIGLNDDCARVTGVEIPIAVEDAMAMRLVEWTESA